MASTLNTKINSYALERGIEFDQAFTLTPTRTGTNPLGTFTQNTTPNIVYQAGVGPFGGSGSWKFNWSSTAATNSYFLAASAGTTELLGNTDNDYSVGFWFKVNALPTNASSNTLFTLGSGSGNGFILSLYGSSSSSTGKLLMTFPGGSFTTTSGIILNTWYYFAALRTPTNISFYLNGTLLVTTPDTVTTAAAVFKFGNSVATSTTTDLTWNLSNYYFAPTSVIGSTQISEIYTVGSSSPAINIAATPLTASTNDVTNIISGSANYVQSYAQGSALQTEPTIATTTGDHVEITTSIPVSANFPTAIALASKNILISTITLESQATIQDQVSISAGTNVSYSANYMSANSELRQPILPPQPLTATATFPAPTTRVTVSYYTMVKRNNPYFYINDGASAPAMNGYQSLTRVNGNGLSFLQDGGAPLSMIGEGKSWYTSGTNSGSSDYFEYTAPSLATSNNALISTRNYALEMWMKPTVGVGYNQTHVLFLDAWLKITRNYNNSITVNIGTDQAIVTTASGLYTTNNWHHLVVNISPTTGNGAILQVWIDGNLAVNQSISYTTYSGTDYTFRIGGYGISNLAMYNYYFDEIAIYPSALSNSEILDHFYFANALSPNRNVYAEPMTALTTDSVNSFIVEANVNYPQTIATASALAVTSAVTAGRSQTIIATPILANADIVIPQVEYSTTYSAQYMNSYAESTNAFALNTIYYDYIMANVNPYRYVSFDGSDVYNDYGSDNDYSVIPTTIGGSIANPDYGINGKSAKTAGISYITDGVILKESEWNDTWGTDGSNYHSSFWIERAEDDQSTNGLRVIHSTYGQATGAYGILYQYQNKLHFELSNGTDRATFTTTENVNLFDYSRHMVLINFHVQGANTIITVYVDAVAKLVIDVPHAQGILQNSLTYLSPNDEANNFNRFAVGCLIPPFANTSLPVQPTNTKIYVDEIVWAKTQVTQSLVTNIYNIMPGKIAKTIVATPMSASDELINPFITTQAIITQTTITANAEIINPLISADRESINIVSVMSASSIMPNALKSVNIYINSDVFVASTYLIGGEAKITVPGGPMIATVTMPKNITPKSPVSIYMKYLIAKTLVTQQILREVK